MIQELLTNIFEDKLAEMSDEEVLEVIQSRRQSIKWRQEAKELMDRAGDGFRLDDERSLYYFRGLKNYPGDVSEGMFLEHSGGWNFFSKRDALNLYMWLGDKLKVGAK